MRKKLLLATAAIYALLPAAAYAQAGSGPTYDNAGNANVNCQVGCSGGGGGGNVTVIAPVGQTNDVGGVSVTFSTNVTQTKAGQEGVVTYIADPATGLLISYSAPTFVQGPTANGSAAANPPVLMGGTVDGTGTGNVENIKISTGGNVFANVFGPTAHGSAAANPPVIMGGTVDGTGTGTVENIKVDSSGDQFHILQAATTGGTTNGYSGNVTNSATAADASPGQLYGWYIGNTNTSQCYLQFFDLATGSVTLGSTAPKFSFMIPANSSGPGGANVLSALGPVFATAITVAATTTRSGASACSNGLDVNLFIK